MTNSVLNVTMERNNKLVEMTMFKKENNRLELLVNFEFAGSVVFNLPNTKQAFIRTMKENELDGEDLVVIYNEFVRRTK